MNSTRLYPAVALISGSLMVLELCYTRISSVILSYHYVFLVVSIAMLGLGLGGLVAARLQRPEDSKVSAIAADLGRWAALTSLAAAVCFLPVALLPYVSAVLFYAVAAFLPFFLPESSSPASSTC